MSVLAQMTYILRKGMPIQSNRCNISQAASEYFTQNSLSQLLTSLMDNKLCR